LWTIFEVAPRAFAPDGSFFATGVPVFSIGQPNAPKLTDLTALVMQFTNSLKNSAFRKAFLQLHSPMVAVEPSASRNPPKQ
jgi:hypothetical protein